MAISYFRAASATGIVPPRAEQVAKEVEPAEHSERPIKQDQPFIVQVVVVVEPALATAPSCDHQSDEYRADEGELK